MKVTAYPRALLIATFALLPFSAGAQTLTVNNGNFSNLTNLTPLGGPWYGGVPAGWTFTGSTGTGYSVYDTGGGNYAANLSVLGIAYAGFNPLTQNVGTLGDISTVTLTFDLSQPITANAISVGAALYNSANDGLLGNTTLSSSGTFTLTAKNIAAGTGIKIAFWTGIAPASYPFLDNVSISSVASSFAWNGGVGGVWTNGGGSGWLDTFDNAAIGWNNALPVVARFTNAAAGTNVTVAANGVNVGNLQVGGTNYTFSGGTITMTNTTWSVGANTTNSVASTLAGTTGLIKGDSGTLALGASNSYSGATAVNAGTLTIADGNALGSTAQGTTVASGAQLRLVATNSGFTVGSEALTISGQGVTTGGALRNAAGDNTWQGNITLATNATIGAASGTSLTLDVAAGNAISGSGYSLTFDGQGTNRVLDSISLGAGAITKIGTGRTILAESNSYSGGTTLTLGTLTISNASALGSGALTVNGGTLDLGGNNLTAVNLGGTGGTISLGANTLTASMSSGGQFNGTITGSGGLVKTGASYLTLAGSNSYTGGTVVNQDILYVIGGGTLGDAAGAVTISNAVLDLRNQQTRTGTITMIGQDARLLSGDVNNPGSVVNNGDALQFGGGQITASISGTGGLNVTAGGSLASSNSYTGDTTISGTTGWYGANSLFVDNAHGLGAASGSFIMSGGIVSLQNNTVTRSGNLTISGGTVQTGTFSKSGSDYDIQGGNINVVLAGTAGVTKSSTNGAVFNAVNTYTGDTTVSAGTLQVNGTLSDAAGSLTVSGSGNLDLRSQQTRTGTITMNSQNARILSGNGSGLIVNNGGAFQFGGGWLDAGLSGTGGMNVTGGGRITSSNSYSGDTMVSGTTGWFGTDTLYVDNANGLGAASGNLTVSGGRVDLSNNTITRSGNLTISGNAALVNGTLSKSGTDYDIQGGNIQVALAGTAGVTKSSTNGAAFNAANTYTGDTTINGGTLFVGAGGTLGAATGAVSLVGSGSGSTYVTLDLRSQQTRTGAISMTNQDARIISGNGSGSIVNNGGAFQFGGGSLEVALSGTGGMNITGGGRITSSNSYTGATTISGTAGWYGANAFFTESAHALGAASGDLTVSGGMLNLYGNTITRSGNLTISGGTITNGTFSKTGTAYDIQGGTIAAVLAGTAGLTKTGAGTATLSGANSYSGGTLLNGGWLVAGHTNAFGTGSITVGSGTTLNLTNFNIANIVINNGGTILSTGTLDDVIATNGTTDIGGNNSTIEEVGGTAVVNVTGSSVVVSNATGGTLNADGSSVQVASVSGGTVNLGGGSAVVTAASGGTVNANASGATLGTVSGTAAVNIAGTNARVATLSGGSVAANASGLVVTNFNGGNIAVSNGVTVGLRGGSSSGVISGQGGIAKQGADTLTLSGVNTLSGATTVEQGKLVVNGSLNNSAVTVQSGATLGGNGSIGTLTLNGILAPGNSAGQTDAGTTAWNQGGSYNWEIFNLADAPGTSWDLLNITNGSLNLSGITSPGGFTINLITLTSNNSTPGALSGFNPTATYTNWLIASAPTINDFNVNRFALNSASFVGATGTFALEQRAYGGGQGLYLTYAGSEPIPEPGTWAAAALLAAAAGLRRVLRRKPATPQERA